MIHRRTFLTRGALVTTAVAVATPASLRANDTTSAIDPELVGQFVGKSHFDLKTVTALLDREPALVNAAWDWGNGDWETGLGAASHVGRPDIATLILERGARIDIFAATMLGHERIVKAFLDEIPAIHRVRGPHRIPLLSHALVGRDASAGLVERLLDRGADVNAQAGNGKTPLMVAASIGRSGAIELLLARGANPELKDAEGRTAIAWATEREHPLAVQALRARLTCPH